MPHDPAEFAREIVIPTVEEFREDPMSRRRGYLAAIVVYHLRDHIAEALVADGAPDGHDVKSRDVTKAATEVDLAVRSSAPPDTFDIVRGVANGSKHGVTRSAHAVPFTAGSDWMRPPAFADVMVCDLSFVDDETGGLEIPYNGRGLDVYHAVQATLSTFLALYPGHLGGCNFEP